jgi:hypothetical protein
LNDHSLIYQLLDVPALQAFLLTNHFRHQAFTIEGNLSWTDNWTPPDKLEFQPVTYHFVSSEDILRKALLCLPELLKGHADIEVAPVILDSIQIFGIVDRIGYITSDNVSSNDKAMSA